MRISSRLFIVLFTLLASHAIAADLSDNDSVRETTTLSQRSRSDVTTSSQAIDNLVEQNLAAHQQRPNPICDDETFLRRIYLDVVGRIPDYDEAKTFLQSRDSDKRAKLIDDLLESPGYNSHQYNYWADILRIKNRLGGGNPGKPYIDFVKASIAHNTPYDEFVRELLTADGPALQRGNGAVGYYLRDRGMPEDNMANTVRVFLGTRLECAQCHDHPFDKWTQREFFEMVAFRGGVNTRNAPNGKKGAALAKRRQINKSDANAKVKQLAINMLRPLTYGVFGSGTGLARLPDSYQYDDGKPNEIVTAKPLFGEDDLVHPTIPVSRKQRKRRRRPGQASTTEIPGAREIGSRDVFADWLTSPDNPRFTQVIANRLWKKTMGLGLIEPVDDMSDASEASNPELLEYLAEHMVAVDYDLKQFYRTIYNSKSYQREASDADIEDPTTYHFPGPLLRRLSAEQLWDSFLTLAVPDLDTRENPRDKIARAMIGKDPYDSFEKVKDMSIDEILAKAEEELELRNNPKKRREQMKAAMMSANEDTKFAEEAKEMRQRIAKLRVLQKRMRKNKNKQAVRRIQAQITELSQQLRFVPTRVGADLLRASELQSPAPPGHFLREFGQSDREQIENANSEPAVNQVLSLMNGQIEKRIISNPRTVLMRNVVKADSVPQKIDVIFLSMLSRKPSRSEKKLWLEAGRKSGPDAANDLIWTLANTSEFMFVR